MLSSSIVSDSRDPIASSLTGSSVHGILQTRKVKWIAISFSGNIPDSGIEPRSPELQVDSLLSESPRKPSGREVSML